MKGILEIGEEFRDLVHDVAPVVSEQLEREGRAQDKADGRPCRAAGHKAQDAAADGQEQGHD